MSIFTRTLHYVTLFFISISFNTDKIVDPTSVIPTPIVETILESITETPLLDTALDLFPAIQIQT